MNCRANTEIVKSGIIALLDLPRGGSFLDDGGQRRRVRGDGGGWSWWW